MTPIRLACASVVVLAVVTLVNGCGGGGESDAAAATAPSAAQPTASGPGEPTAPGPADALTTFLVNGEGGVGTLKIGLDASGNVTQSGTHYQLQAGGPSGCTMTSEPSDPSVASCNTLAGGKGFLLCENTLSPHFNFTFFRESDVQVATHWELGGRTLTGLSCGTSGPRTTAYTFTFSSDAETAIEQAGPITNNYGAGIPDLYDQPTGYQSFANLRQRWVIYKVSSGAATQYFLLVLSQTDPTLPARPVNLYFLQI